MFYLVTYFDVRATLLPRILSGSWISVVFASLLVDKWVSMLVVAELGFGFRVGMGVGLRVVLVVPYSHVGRSRCWRLASPP